MDTPESKLKRLSEEVRALWLEMDKTSTEQAILMGNLLLTAKELAQKKKDGKKEKWEDCRKRLFDDVDTRSSQRYMRLAQHIENPGLFFLPQTTLLKLITRSGKMGVNKFLSQHNLQVNSLDEEDLAEMANFKKAVTKLIAPQTRKGADKSKKSSEKQPATPNDLDSFERSVVNMSDSIDSLPCGEEVEPRYRKMKFKVSKLRSQLNWLLSPVKPGPEAA